MAIKNQALTIHYLAWHAFEATGQTGDAANHTLRFLKDGVAVTPTNSPEEVDAVNLPGIYKLVLTADETNCAIGTLTGVSSTRRVMIIPVNLDFSANPLLDRELAAYARGAVFVDGSHAATTSTFYTTLPTRADGYGNMVLRFDDGAHSGVWRKITSGVTSGSYTLVTLATALSAAPTDGMLVTAAGNKE